MQSSKVRRVPPTAAFRRLLAALLLPLGLVSVPQHLSAQTSAIPPLISYQGRVSDAAGVMVGATAPVNRLVTFRIWNHPSDSAAANLMYSEQQTVTISQGEFSVLVGQGTAVAGETSKGTPTVTIGSASVFREPNRYLGVTVDDGTSAVDTEISPRQQMVSAAYSLRAKYAEFVGANGGNALTALDSGFIGIGIDTPSQRLHIAGSSLTTGTAFLLDTNHSIRAISGSGVAISTNGAPDGLFLGQTTGNVGIGTTAPTQRLHIVGNSLTTGTVFLSDTNHSIRAISGSGMAISASGAANGLVLQQTTGNVGIGISNPTAKLDVNGIGKFEGGAQIGNTQQGFFADGNNVGLRLLPGNTGHIYFQNNAGLGTHMIVRNTGRVGIGVDDPSTKLHVAGAIRQSSVGDFAIDSTTATGGRFIVKEDGKVGIGTNNPTKGKLEIDGTVSYTHPASGYGSGGGKYEANFREHSQSFPNVVRTVSIYASGDVIANQYYAISDVRTKNVAGRSDSASDLAMLMKVEVTDYSFKDTVAKGAQMQKKVVAQQVETVFPQAVRRSRDTVPDIYQHASVTDGWLALATDLKKGERVRLIVDGHDGVYDVVTVEPGRFLTTWKGTREGDKVFVFGREVNDFRTVDYEAIAMLNVSATQEVKREKDAEVKQLREQNNALTAEVTALRSQIAALAAQEKARDAKLASIEKLLQSSQTVMAQPAKAATANGQE